MATIECQQGLLRPQAGLGEFLQCSHARSGALGAHCARARSRPGNEPERGQPLPGTRGHRGLSSSPVVTAAG